jgi:hypothetical protein
MSDVTTQQLAQLMIGIARAQLAIVDSIENSKAGFKFTHVRPTLETASRIRSNHTETLADFPSRLLLQMMGRNAPDLDRVTRDLEGLVGGGVATAGDPAAADSLDMTQT